MVDDLAVVWFRRDLRLDDNPAWATATRNHATVAALFVYDHHLLERAGRHRRRQLLASVAALSEQLGERGGGLHLRSGPADRALPGLIEDLSAAAVYWNDDVTPYATRRDAAVVAELTVPAHRSHGSLVHAPGTVLTAKGTLSQVFTPFWKRWEATPLVAWPDPDPDAARIDPGSGELLTPDDTPPMPAGADAALDRLLGWLERVDDYATTRDLPGVDGTSALSADLKLGTLGPRQVLEVVGAATPGRAAFVRQLAWRDWYAHLLAERPDLADRAVRPAYDRIRWRDDEAGFRAWAEGRTGYPIVDAGMRQLLATGWMHNRVRMIAASFLVKDLLIDWRRGERWFRHHLVDGDVAQNAGNWQWVAGTGPDAAPYFRIFNPVGQSQKFDPGGDYVRRWVPELGSLSAPAIHAPWEAPPLELVGAGVVLGDTYPPPLLDHGVARNRTLAEYKRATG